MFAADKKSKKTNVPAQMDENKKILHALNRFTFGPRPGEVDAVRAMGLEKWFDQQLHPDKIDDSALDARLSPFRTLKMSTHEMMENFPDNQMVRMIENGRGSTPSDPAKRAIYQSRMAEYERRQQKKEDAAADVKPEAQAQNQNTNNDDQMTPEQRQALDSNGDDTALRSLAEQIQPCEAVRKELEQAVAENWHVLSALRNGVVHWFRKKPTPRAGLPDTSAAIVSPIPSPYSP